MGREQLSDGGLNCSGLVRVGGVGSTAKGFCALLDVEGLLSSAGH